MMTDPILATRKLPIGTDGSRVPLTFRVEGGLHYIRGNAAPYFSLTYTQHRAGFPDQCYAGGAGHDTIARYYGDRFADLAALHLADIDGVPSHAEANGWYWLAGALGGAGERYHGGNGERQHWRPDGTFDGYRLSTLDECLATFAEHARVSIDEAAAIRDACLTATNPDGWQGARSTMARLLDEMRPRWRAEALAAITRHGLRVYGDPWPGGGTYAAHRAGTHPVLVAGCDDCNSPGAIAERNAARRLAGATA